MRIASAHLVSSNPADAGAGLAVPLTLTPVAIPSGTLTGSFTCPPQYVAHFTDANFQISTAGTITGSLTLAQSNDSEQFYFNNAKAPYGIQNWSNLITLDIQGSGQAVINLQDQGMKFLQVSWTQTGGTGSMDINFAAKGAS